MQDITFHAEVIRVKTMADGSLRVELGLPETAVLQAAQLMTCQVHGSVLSITAEAKVLQSLSDGKTTTDERNAPDPLGMGGG